MIPFNELKVGDFFYFYNYTWEIRRKVSAKKYIWIKDGDIVYCNSDISENSRTVWITKARHLPKVTKIDYNYYDNKNIS